MHTLISIFSFQPVYGPKFLSRRLLKNRLFSKKLSKTAKFCFVSHLKDIAYQKIRHFCKKSAKNSQVLIFFVMRLSFFNESNIAQLIVLDRNLYLEGRPTTKISHFCKNQPKTARFWFFRHGNVISQWKSYIAHLLCWNGTHISISHGQHLLKKSAILAKKISHKQPGFDFIVMGLSFLNEIHILRV